MKRVLFLLAIFSFNLNAAQEQLPPPYNQVEELLPFKRHGWYLNAVPMEKYLKDLNAKVVIELGSWLGLSTSHIATVLPEDGVVYAVDHWAGTHEYEHLKHMLPTLYQQFLSNIIHANLTHKITPMKMTTLEAVKVFLEEGIVPDLVYVDACHDEASVYEDISAYYPLIKGHGVICGNDWGWGHDLPVRKAVTRFARENRLRIEIHHNWFWVLHEDMPIYGD